MAHDALMNVTEGESLFGNLIKGLAPIGAPLTPVNPGVGVPPVPGVPSNQIGRGGCPLCDSSVYSYCSGKLLHDACCCNGGKRSSHHRHEPHNSSSFTLLLLGAGLPFNCQAMDCSFFAANSCQEHALIFTCCCNNPYHK